jgi:hypothetical protein
LGILVVGTFVLAFTVLGKVKSAVKVTANAKALL